jgi:ADP-dependent NAD(P)H-hydrate dehydratase
MLGIDIVEINKFERKFPKFKEKIFTKNEIAYCSKHRKAIEKYAGIFAAKEAIIKAHNLNLAYILRQKIEILHDNKRPYYKIEDNIYKASTLSISHDGNFALAVCDGENSYPINIEMKDLLPKRDKNSHKGTFGRIAILGGSKGMAGSVFMASKACLRTGAGLCYIICPESISDILQIKSTEAIIKEVSCDRFYYSEDILDQILELIKDMDVLCLGPGMSQGEGTELLIGEILKNFDKKVIIDADGLNAIARDPSILKLKKNMILTPHPKEFSRLCKLDMATIKKDRINIAKNFARENSVILVLKGHRTIVTDGYKVYENISGNPGMATAGSGDVLSGIIASLLHMLDPFDAAKFGVYIHGLAGDIASMKLSQEAMLASDITDNIHEVFKMLRG